MRHKLLVSSLLLACSCAGDVPPQPPAKPPTNLYARVQIDPSGLRITGLGTKPAATPFAAPGTQPLSYELLDAAGTTLASGQVGDPRLATFEAFDGVQPQWIVSSVGTGGATIALPPRAGTLVIRDASGELGRVAFDPSAPVATPLLSTADVRSTTKIVDHGASEGHLNLAIMSEGYTDAELPQFDQAVASFVAELQQTDGFVEHWDQINVWRIDVRSQDSGAGTGGTPKHTAFDTAYDTNGVHRLLAMETQGARDAATRLRQQVGADAGLVIVNASDYGGSGDGGDVVSVIYAGAAADGRGVASISAHELGHSIWHLADEYEDAALCDPAHPFTAANIALSSARSSLPWASLVAASTPLPTTANDTTTIGAYEGAAYCATGRFRPQHDCRMRSLDHGYCAVCLAQIDQYFTALGPPPATTQIPAVPSGLSPDQQVAAGNAVQLAWTPSAGTTSYWLDLGHWDANGKWVDDSYGSVGAVSSENETLAAATGYAFAVAACNDAGCSAWSAYASFSTP